MKDLARSALEVVEEVAPNLLSPTGADPYTPGHGDGSYDVLHYDVTLDYRVETNRLGGQVALRIRARDDLRSFDLDLRGLRVTKVKGTATGDGRAAAVERFSQRRGKVNVRLRSEVPAGEEVGVVVAYEGRPEPVASTWGDVGWEELGEGSLVASQPCGAPSWLPCNDRPSNKATYSFTITAESVYTVVANGELTSSRRRSSTTTWTYEQPEPMATYLATVQVGRYDLARTVKAGRHRVEQHRAVPAALVERFDHDFGRQPQMLEVFGDLFGSYPFGAYTVVVTADDLEIPLEAQGLSIFGANHLDGERGAERLVAHELAHQWFGNSLTTAAWSQIWLHEGFACYAEWLWSAESGGRSTHELATEARGRLSALPQDVVTGAPGADDMFDDRVYKRGALTLHAIRLTVGDEPFFDLLRSWTAAHRHGTVTTEGFVAHAEESTGVELRDLVDRWLLTEALPELPEQPTP